MCWWLINRGLKAAVLQISRFLSGTLSSLVFCPVNCGLPVLLPVSSIQGNHWAAGSFPHPKLQLGNLLGSYPSRTTISHCLMCDVWKPLFSPHNCYMHCFSVISGRWVNPEPYLLYPVEKQKSLSYYFEVGIYIFVFVECVWQGEGKGMVTGIKVIFFFF